MNHHAPTFSERIRTFLADRRVRLGGSVAILVAVLIFAGIAVSKKRAEEARRARCVKRAKGVINHELTAPANPAVFPWQLSKKRRFRVVYSFEVDGATYTGESIWPFRPQGKYLAVNYDPADPATSFSDHDRAPDF